MAGFRRDRGFSVHLVARTRYNAFISFDRIHFVAFVIALKRRARAVAAPVIFLGITGYFVWSVTQGNRGLMAHAQRQDLLRQVQDDNATAKKEREQWERRVAGLRGNQLNPDTLDERARAMLNLADPADIVVQYGAKDKLF